MAREQVLGLFDSPSAAADALGALTAAGVAESDIELLSHVPWDPESLGRPRRPALVGRFALGGALLGLAAGMGVLAAAFVLYPLGQGGQPNTPVPPSLIVLFETTMLGT